MRETCIVIAAGGTGGHLYPAQALADQISRQSSNLAVVFAGHGLTINPFFNARKYPAYEIQSGHFGFPSWRKKLGSAIRLATGFFRAWRLLGRLRPAVVVGFGSFHSLPVLMAAKVRRIPIVLHEGNAVPGRVNVLFSGSARVTAVQFPEAAQKLKGRILKAGMPLREGYTALFGSKEEARRYFGLYPDRFTILVFGGSQGSAAINALFSKMVTTVLPVRPPRFQVIHLTGDPKAAEDLASEYDAHDIRACVKTFEPCMDQAWLASDLAVTRSGAVSLAEQIEFEVPGVLIPYPFAADRHQDYNADFMAREVRGAVKVLESDADAELLADVLGQLMENDQKRLTSMQENIRKFKLRDTHGDLCSVVCEVAGVKVR